MHDRQAFFRADTLPHAVSLTTKIIILNFDLPPHQPSTSQPSLQAFELGGQASSSARRATSFSALPPVTSNRGEIRSLPRGTFDHHHQGQPSRKPVTLPICVATQVAKLDDMGVVCGLAPVTIAQAFILSKTPDVTPSREARQALSNAQASEFQYMAERIELGAVHKADRPQWKKYLQQLTQAMESDKTLLQTCMDLIEESHGSCEDRPILMLQEIDMARLERKALLEPIQFDELFIIGLGFYRLKKIDRYVYDAINKQSDTEWANEEAVECYLFARHFLRYELELPLPFVQPLYHHLGARYLPELDASRMYDFQDGLISDEVKDNGQDLAEFLASWPPMSAYLSARSSELRKIHAAIDDRCHTIMEMLATNTQGNCFLTHQKEANFPTLKLSGKAVPGPHDRQFLEMKEQTYLELIVRCKNEAQNQISAANLVALNNFMPRNSRHLFETNLSQLLKIPDANLSKQLAIELAQGLDDQAIPVDWIHPTKRFTYLNVAVEAGDINLMRKLLALGVPTASRDSSGLYISHYAAMKGSAEMIKVLQEFGVRFDVLNKNGCTPLHIAVTHAPAKYTEQGYPPYLKAIETILCPDAKIKPAQHSGAASINVVDEAWGFTALALAAATGKVRIVRLLLSCGADPSLPSARGKSVASLLKKKGATDGSSKKELKQMIHVLRQSEKVFISIHSAKAASAASTSNRGLT